VQGSAGPDPSEAKLSLLRFHLTAPPASKIKPRIALLDIVTESARLGSAVLPGPAISVCRGRVCVVAAPLQGRLSKCRTPSISVKLIAQQALDSLICVEEALAVSHNQTTFLFDLDGTLVDSVYHHVLAWQEALETEGIELSVWRIHRKIGMSGGLFTNMLLRETGLKIDAERIDRLRRLHNEAYSRRCSTVRPLPGARELLSHLTRTGIPWAIATSGRMETAGPVLDTLGVDLGGIPVITRDQVKYAKPDPDLFLTAAARLGVDIESTSIVGDSVWDMLASRRARALGIGLLSGGYGREELERAGAYRVYEDPAELLRFIARSAAELEPQGSRD
jgi:phosphoglycolate phosphatase-like HAD superfamily hydrolase